MADMQTHGENLERVALRIAPAVMEFCRQRCRRESKLFHADELRKYVTAMTGINAPASADRVLRDLNQRRLLHYILVSRHESLYEIVWVRPERGGDEVEPQPSGQTPPGGNDPVQTELLFEEGEQLQQNRGIAAK